MLISSKREKEANKKKKEEGAAAKKLESKCNKSNKKVVREEKVGEKVQLDVMPSLKCFVCSNLFNQSIRQSLWRSCEDCENWCCHLCVDLNFSSLSLCYECDEDETE